VIAVIAGHLHSSVRSDYDPPYPNTSVPDGRLFVSPPLAIKNQENAPVPARGVSFYRVEGSRVTRQVVWHDRESGFSAQRPPPGRGNALEAGLAAGRPPLTRDRVGIVVLAVLAAICAAAAAFRRSRDLDDDVVAGNTSWPQRMRISSIIVCAVVGFAVAMILFGSTWDYRAAVALPYLLAFVVTLIPALALAHMLDREAAGS
jgi:hypothetical protein